MTPLIYVVMPVNNCEKHIAEAVESCNIGIRKSRGKYIARMDGDDISLPDRFDRQLAYMEANPGVGVCGTWIEYFGAAQGFYKSRTEPEYIKACMLVNLELTHPTLFLRASVFKGQSLLYDPSYMPEDYELFSRAVHLIEIANMPRVLLKYRISASNITMRETRAAIDNIIKITCRNLKMLGVDVPPAVRPLLVTLRSFLNSQEDLKNIDILFERIIEANRERRIYDASALEYALCRHRASLSTPLVRTPFPKEIRDIITRSADAIPSRRRSAATTRIRSTLSTRARYSSMWISRC